jgi:hypothetical protein
VWTSESLPVVSYNKTWDLLSRSLSTSLLQLISIGLCHYEVCLGSDENNTDCFFGGKYPLVCMLLGKLLSSFLSLTESLAYRMWNITSILQWHQQVYSSHITQQILGTPCNILYTLSPIDHGLSRICSNKNRPFLDWYSYIPNYSMQNSHPAKWQLCWSQRPWGLRRRSVVVRCLGSRVPIAVSACIFASCVCRVLCK